MVSNVAWFVSLPKSFFFFSIHIYLSLRSLIDCFFFVYYLLKIVNFVSGFPKSLIWQLFLFLYLLCTHLNVMLQIGEIIGRFEKKGFSLKGKF